MKSENKKYLMVSVSYMTLPGLLPGIRFLNKSSAVINDIIDLVCEQAELIPKMLYRKDRTRNIVDARHTVMYLAKTHTGMSYKSIGEAIGFRDHTTVIHAVRKVQNMMETNERFKQRILSIENKL